MSTLIVPLLKSQYEVLSFSHYQAPRNEPITLTSWPSALLFYNSGGIKMIIQTIPVWCFIPRIKDRSRHTGSRSLLGNPGSRHRLTNTLLSITLSTEVPLSHSFSSIQQIHKTRLRTVSIIDTVSQHTHWLPRYILKMSLSWHYEPAQLEQQSLQKTLSSLNHGFYWAFNIDAIDLTPRSITGILLERTHPLQLIKQCVDMPGGLRSHIVSWRIWNLRHNVAILIFLY